MEFCVQAFLIYVSIVTLNLLYTVPRYCHIPRLRTKGRASDSTILKAYIQKYLSQIMQLLGVVPSDLLLLFKTSDCLRHLDLLLGSDLNTSAGNVLCV